MKTHLRVAMLLDNKRNVLLYIEFFNISTKSLHFLQQEINTTFGTTVVDYKYIEML